jgi:hypothetical protein
MDGLSTLYYSTQRGKQRSAAISSLKINGANFCIIWDLKNPEKLNMKPWEDPENVANSEIYYTGEECIEEGCHNPAGTAWSEDWCQVCNAKRINKEKKYKKTANNMHGGLSENLLEIED